MRLPKVVVCVSILVTWATILASRGYFGGTWKKQEGHEGVQNQILIDFGSILGLCFSAFWVLRLGLSIFVRARLQVTYCTDLLGRNLEHGQKHIFTNSSTRPITADKQTVSEIRSHGALAKGGRWITLDWGNLGQKPCRNDCALQFCDKPVS